jgi:uncharacterized protein YkwD
VGNVRAVPGNRRPSPGLLLLALVLVCAVPLGVAAATGLTDDQAKQDQVETAGESPQPASATRADGGRSRAGHGEAGSHRSTPPPTGIADIPPADPSTTTTTTTTPGTEAPPATSPPATAPAPTTGTTVVVRLSPVDQVLLLVNDARAHAATPCGPIQLDPRLMAAAQAHSDDMANRNFFDHTNPDGATFSQRILATGYPEVAMAENIAKGQRSASQVMQAWMSSTMGHRENIENCAYNFMGIGVNRNAWTWTQDFAA